MLGREIAHHVLDILERANLIRREKAAGDRRQVLLRLLPERQQELDRVAASFAEAWGELCARHGA